MEKLHDISVNVEKNMVAKKEALKTSTIARFLPNTITISSMCFGLTAIKFAQIDECKCGVFCILVSAFLDMFDGKIARFLDQSSAIGLELDSLSDLICFGVAPSIVLYSTGLKEVGIVGWAISLFYTVCCALRLARFNATHSDPEQVTELDRNYFVGIPAPAGAAVAMFPLIYYFETNNSEVIKPLCIGFFLLFSGCLMVSTIRTYSSKIVKLNEINKLIVLAVITLVAVCLAVRFWMFAFIFIALYLLTIPFSIYTFSKATTVKKN